MSVVPLLNESPLELVVAGQRQVTVSQAVALK
jgi:hypothetical protein